MGSSDSPPASNNSENFIEIYLRLCPAGAEGSGAAAEYEVNHEESSVQWLVPRQAPVGIANHQREKYGFSFTGIFGTDATQEVVFDTAARKVAVGALDGYNGTIFAYGQTGSGKTYTITGSAERYAERGLIPRTLSLIFSELAKRSDHTYILHFAYLEIYNETGYDLLNPDHETKTLEELPKVTMLEDGENCFHLRNLSQHLATNEEEALNLLFVGETNRMISATPMNLASSRSHCIFTVTIEARRAGEDTVRKSKLHLVDLAGSERVWKKGIDGQVLKEAKYINLSLHFLEQVIIALQEKTQGRPRHHIPYRNSFMTSVLRDSIGGNSLTVMVATVTTAQQHLEETISTCRFAQRVALVSNQVTLNEEIDQNLLIKRLKQEVKDLKEELQLLRGDQERGPLTANELANLKSQIKNFLVDSLPDASLNCGGTMVQIRTAFQIFKEMFSGLKDQGLLKDNEMDVPALPLPVLAKVTELTTSPSTLETINSLTHQLQQRENEINILVSFIKRRMKGMEPTFGASSEQQQVAPGISSICKPSFQSSNVDSSGVGLIEGDDLPARPRPRIGSEKLEENCCRDLCSTSDREEDPEQRTNWSSHNQLLQSNVSTISPADKCAAFEIFCGVYPKWDAIKENKALLKAKYAEAKFLGEQVNKAREKINELKATIEKGRTNRAIQNLMQNGKASESEVDCREEELISMIATEKILYKENFNALRDLKKEIEGLHVVLKQSHLRLKADFEEWMKTFCKKLSETPLPLQHVQQQQDSDSLETSFDPKELSLSTTQKTRLHPCQTGFPAVGVSKRNALPPFSPPVGSENSLSTMFQDLPSVEKPYGQYIQEMDANQFEESQVSNIMESEFPQQNLDIKTSFIEYNDAHVDKDIEAFYKAHSQVLSKTQTYKEIK